MTTNVEPEEIYSLTRQCNELFEKWLSPDPPKLAPAFISFIDSQYRSFKVWAAYSGALASVDLSLDERLRDHQHIKLAVAELLELSSRCLSDTSLSEEDHPADLSTRKPETLSEGSRDDLQATLKDALESLHKLASAIRRSAAPNTKFNLSSRFSRVEGFYEPYYEEFAKRFVRYQFPHANIGLCDQIGKAMSQRRSWILFTQRRGIKLARNRDEAPMPSSLPDTTLRSAPIPSIPKAPVPQQIQRLMPIKASVSSTRASVPKSTLYKRFIHGPAPTSTAQTKHRSTTRNDSYDYPDVPPFQPGDNRRACPYCLEPLLRSDMATGWWKRHYDKDTQPFVCLSEDCASPLMFFSTYDSWREHMRKHHSSDWTRQIHSHDWFCDIGHSEITFLSRDELETHLRFEHNPAPSDSQIRVLLQRKRRTALRDPPTCPLCESRGIEVGLSSPSEDQVRSQLWYHISEHLHSLLKWCVPPESLTEAEENPPPSERLDSESSTSSIGGSSNLLQSEKSVTSINFGSESGNEDGLPLDRPEDNQIPVLTGEAQSNFDTILNTRLVMHNPDDQPPIMATVDHLQQTTTSTYDEDDSIKKYPIVQIETLPESTRKYFRRLYNSLCGMPNSLSRDRFAAFLEKSQGEEVLPLKKDEYKYEEFLEVWSCQYQWDAQAPVADEIDLQRSLANYFISSSHNTYLVGNQVSSEASSDPYRKVLQNGCRCIEIDVWNCPPKSDPRSTPIRSKSPSGRRPNHKSSSTSTKVQEGIDAITALIAGKLSRQRHRSPGLSQPAPLAGPSGESSSGLAPHPINERLGRPRSRARSSSRKQSRSAVPRYSYEPVVMHAHNFLSNDWSLGTWVGFREVCEAIKETAFQENHMPIIVSLEVHADTEQQEVMVEIMKEVWGDLLLDKPCQGSDPRLRLPWLEDIQGKILIKVKRMLSKTLKPNGGTAGSLGVSLHLFDESVVPGSEEDRAATAAMGRGRRVRICESLSSLAVYTHSEHFNSFNERSAKTPTHIFSLDENAIASLHQMYHRELFRHNRTFFMRAYPSATRNVDSSNPDPSQCWRKGVQMVALNWQHLDEAMMLNHGMFAGSPGWVLKPQGYRSSDNTDCQAEALHKTINLRITILAGQHIPVPSGQRGTSFRSAFSRRANMDFRPCVKCELHVEKSAELCEELTAGANLKEGLLKQRTLAGATDYPTWGNDGTVIDFETIPMIMEELSFVRFRVEDTNTKFNEYFAKQMNNLVGWACIRLDRLRQGYRFVHLIDANGQPTEGKLLVKIEKSVQ